MEKITETQRYQELTLKLIAQKIQDLIYTYEKWEISIKQFQKLLYLMTR